MTDLESEDSYLSTVVLDVGKAYSMDNEETRITEVKVTDNKGIAVAENLWPVAATDSYSTEYKWEVTAELKVSKSCEDKHHCLSQAKNNVYILEALGFLDYELDKMVEDGVSIWSKAAHDRE
jgi:hypothetical protein